MTTAAAPRSCRRRPGRAMKVAIVDLGTNTCRLFLARVEDGRVLQDARVTTVVRLGQGVDKTGRLHPDAVARTHACLAGYAPRVEAYGPARRLLVATSVLRDATDGRQFLRAIVAQRVPPPLARAARGGGGQARLPRRHVVARRRLRAREPDAGPDRDAGAGPDPAGRHRRRQHGVRRRHRRRAAGVRAQPRRRRGAAHRAILPRRPAAGGGGRGPGGPRRRRRRGRACRPTCAPRCAAWSAWPARTPRSSPTSSG